jgi:tetratricopeptide (TPR) repeat protein
VAAAENPSNVKNWMVKSSTKILGPYTREEVVAFLTKRQITIIDEIRQPDSRWNYIRESRHFKEIVKNLRYEDDHSKEDTMTSTATSGNTATKTEGPEIADDFTPTPVSPSKAVPAPAEVPILRDVTPSAEARSKFPPGMTAKSFGNLDDQRVQSKIQKQNLYLRSLLLLIFVGSIVIYGYSFFRKDKKADLSYDQLITSALRYKELGLYQKSLELYKKAAAIHEVDLESQFQMVFLLINEDRQSLKGRRTIERALLKEGRSRQDIIAGHLGMALSYMMEGDLRQAEDYLQKTLGFDANNEPAKVNLAVIQLKKGNYSQALKSFEAQTKGDALGFPLILLGKTISIIELSKRQVDKERIHSGVNEIKAYVGKSHFLKKELLLMLIYMNQLLDDSKGQLDAISAFMDEPQEVTKLYAKDLRLDWRNTDWDYLEKYCSDLFASGKGPMDMKAVRAICLMESHRDSEAAKMIDESLAQAPKQLSSIQAQAEQLKKLGRLNEAQILFQSTDFKQTNLALYIQGENSLKNKDYAGAESAYKALTQKDFGDVLAHYGLAQVNLGKNDRPQAQGEIKAGFEAETNFAPLIELRDKLEAQ